MPIIQSLLDTDLYKFTMLQVVLHRFPQAHGVYEFRCRNKETVYPLADIIPELEQELNALCELRLSQDELGYLRGLRFIKSDFLDYLELFQLKRRFVQIWGDEQGRLNIRIEGPVIQAMFFEIYILAIVNELYFRRLETPAVLAEGERRLQEKVALLQQYDALQQPNTPPFLVFDFGTRRRYNLAWQRHVLKTFIQAAPDIVRGTSNVYLARELGITPIGTMAHEFLQAFQSLDVRLRDFQKAALDAWVHEYRGDSASRSPMWWAWMPFCAILTSISPSCLTACATTAATPMCGATKPTRTTKNSKLTAAPKMLTFSDGLDLERAWDLHQYFKGRFKTSFGIGTNLTNDMGHEPLNIVLKLVECNGQSVAKLSDSPGKTLTQNNTFLAYLRQVFDVKDE